MSASTSLIGPYDGIPTHDKIRIMCGVPSAVTKELFDDLFNRRGVQDKILARLFHMFYIEYTSDRVQALLAEAVTMQDREEILNDILNRFMQLQINHENQHVTAEPTTNS